MWGDPRPANRMGHFHGSQEERFAPGWNREYPPSLDSLAQERHSGNFSGRESLPFDIQAVTGHLNPQFASREETSFSFGARDGPHSDFRGGEGHHDFRGRDFPPCDFQNRADSQLDFRGREPPASEFRGREMYSGDFRHREGLHMDFRGGEIPSMDYRNREAFRMNYRDRESHTMDYRGRDEPPSDFRGRGSFDLDFRGRDGSHSDFRVRDMSELDYRGREHSYSDFRNRDVPDSDLRCVGTSDLDFRNRNIPPSDFRNRHRSRSDQDFRGRDVAASMDFTDREMLPVNPSLTDFRQSQSTVPLADREPSGASGNKREESATLDRPSFGGQKGEFQPSEPRAREEESLGLGLETETPLDFQSSHGPVPTLQDQDEVPQNFANKQQLSGGEQQGGESSLEVKGDGDLDFLGRQDTDYRNIEYGDVDHRVAGVQLFDYEHGKSFTEGKPSKDSRQDLQDQDYRTCPKDVKPSKLIRLGGVPESATKDDILSAFRGPDGTRVKGLRLKDYCSGSHYGYVCVEFSLLEEAIGCMEANQGTLVIGGKEVTLEYTPCPEFWRCKHCKVSTVGYRSSCSFCKLPRDGRKPGTEPKTGSEEEDVQAELDFITEAPLEKPEQELPGQPKPEKLSAVEAISPQQCQPQESEPRKREESKERPPSQEKKRDVDRHFPRKESQEPASRREAEETTQQEGGGSKTIMLKRIPRFTPPEVIVGLLAPYVRLSISSVRIMKNKAGRMGHTYGFIELDSHAEALRLVRILQNLDPPICIDGRTVDVNLATGKRRNDYGEHPDHPYYGPGKRGMRDRRGADSQRRSRAQSPSDMSTFIYDPETGNYYDPIAGLYYDPKTQKQVIVNREEPTSPPNSRGRRHGSQERTTERKEPSSRDSRDRKEKGKSTSVKNESGDEKSPAEDVFKKPLPPMVKKEESSTPPKVVNPLIGLLGEYGGDSDNEEEEEEQPQMQQPQPHHPPVPREEHPRKAEGNEEKLTDWNKLACLLCRRQFPNKEVLIKHQQLSNLHKQNLEIHMKIKRSERELAYLEKREREGKSKEKGNDRRERFQRLDSPERKRPKYDQNSESDYNPMNKTRIENNNQGGRMLQPLGWKEGSGLGHNQQGMMSPLEAENWKKGAGLGTQGKPSKRQSNETYRDAVRRVMFARYKELE
ncbi:PREDICTED: RNA-binding protein 6 isoform X2 [Gavialis gangeticus]|uniref:RNA-binding protein 6 isoform X1 n=1 Tax=Gavialis gangeticus TaxID=94835 RepID=UPI00092E7872|nr:PREDICTED: RNA-binding protein 6 isoform X1 [Gavialis gangeticus]XP_019360677.1 PREDICTED: RNA-binding protein 6 isoform X2 [Gavialis gangeticus]